MSVRHVHLCFALVCVFCLLGTLRSALQWQHASTLHAAFAAASDGTPRPAAAAEVRLARAVALSRAGRPAEALALYKALLGEPGAIRQATLYDLANLHLREALRNGPGEAQRALPLVELAKQAYRDALHEDPTDWDARYNLERALWLSPEYDDPVLQRNQAPTHSEHALSTLQGAHIDLP